MKEYCFKCNAMMETNIKSIKKVFRVKGEQIIQKNEVLFCKKCDTELFNEEYDSRSINKAFAEYRRRHNILSPVEIKNIREKYKVSQKDFALILGFGEITITRYENGMIPDKPYSERIRMMENKDNFLKALRESKLSEKERARIIKNIEISPFEIDSIKPQESAFSLIMKIVSISSLKEEAEMKKSKPRKIEINCDMDKCIYDAFGDNNLGVENG
ncbi:MAG: type II TA system antitoxin MqsA family protein [Vulcanibacillus sp.]